MAETNRYQSFALEEFAAAFKPFLPAVGGPADIADGLGMERDDELILRVHRGGVLPDWPFVRDLMKLAARRRPSTNRREFVRRLHRDAVEAFDLPLRTMSVPPDPVRVSGEGVDHYLFYDPAEERIRRVSVGSRLQRPAPRPPKPQNRPAPVEPEPARVWVDAPGYDLKPDPMTVHDMGELLERLREFWQWADRPSMRELAEQSGRAFSKSTVTKLIHEQRMWTKMPALSQKYVVGIVRGCGGGDEEIARWVTAFRLLDMGKCPAYARPNENVDGTVTSFRRPASSQ